MADSKDAAKTDAVDASNGANQDKDKEEGADSKTFSQEQVDEIVGKRLAKAQKQAEEQTKKAIEDALAEAERKAKLSAEERAQEESKKKASELAEKEREIALRENRADARELLSEHKISTSLVDFVVDVDSDKTKENVETLAKAWTEAVEEGVKAKLSGKAPEDKAAGGKTSKDASAIPGVMTGNGKTAF